MIDTHEWYLMGEAEADYLPVLGTPDDMGHLLFGFNCWIGPRSPIDGTYRIVWQENGKYYHRNIRHGNPADNLAKIAARGSYSLGGHHVQ